MIATYTPNFKDPQVLRKVKHVYVFTHLFLREDKPRELACSFLDKHFGQQQNSLSKWLRNLLLLEVATYSVEQKRAKAYVCNTVGRNKLRDMLRAGKPEAKGLPEPVTAPEVITEADKQEFPLVSWAAFIDAGKSLYDFKIVREFVLREYKEELESGLFNYGEERSNRFWHKLQNVDSHFRFPILAEAGYTHDYDIESASAVLIHQHAQQCGMDEWLHAINHYIANKHEVRNRLVKLLRFEDEAQGLKKIKAFISCMFSGAYLSKSPEHSVYWLFDKCEWRIDLLAEDEFISELRADIKKCWEAIEKERIGYKRSATGRKIALNSRTKWAKYFELERQVMSVVEDHLTAVGAKFFLEHDGVKTDTRIDLAELSALIRSRTGFKVCFSESVK